MEQKFNSPHDSFFRKSMKDIMYAVELQKSQKKKAYLYLLAEHQSKPDRIMSFRLLRYMCGIMHDHLQKHKVLPVVYPMVLYHE